MASGEYVVGRDIDFQYADNGPAAEGGAAAGARKKSKKKMKKKKQSQHDQTSETPEQRNKTSRGRIEPLTPEKRAAIASNRRDAGAQDSSSPSSTPGSKAPTPREKRRTPGPKAGKQPAFNNNGGEVKSVTDILHGPNSPFPHLRNKHTPHSQQDHRHLDYSAAEKDAEVWLTTSNEEKESIRKFWRQLTQQERENLAQLDKDMLFQRIRRQRRDCTCTVCGRQREAVEEELEELYTMNYEKLKQYSAKLLEFEALFSDERPPELADAEEDQRRRRLASDGYLGHFGHAHAHGSPSAQKDLETHASGTTRNSASARAANNTESPQPQHQRLHETGSTEHVHAHGRRQPDSPISSAKIQDHAQSQMKQPQTQQSQAQQPQAQQVQPQQARAQQQQAQQTQAQQAQQPHTNQAQSQQGARAQQLSDFEGSHSSHTPNITNEVPFKDRHPLEMLYAHLGPPSDGDPSPVPLLPEVAKRFMSAPENMRPPVDGALDPSLVPTGQAADSWRRVTKTFQDLVLDHLTRSTPDGSQPLTETQVLENLDKAVLGDAQVLEILDKVVRAGRVDPGSLAGGIMGLADDLLRNDGKQFMNMYEQQQTKPGAEQVLQPLKQLYDNYRMAEGVSPSSDFLAQGVVGNQLGPQTNLGTLRNNPGFNLTVRVDSDAPLHGIHDHDHEPEDDEDEFEDAVEEGLEFGNEDGDELDDELDDELGDELDDYTDGYSEAEISTNGDNLNGVTEYNRKEAWNGDEARKSEVSERKRLIEGYAMLRTFTARVFEQRVLQAYREQIARERQQLLLQELAEEESRAAKEREMRKVKEKEKKKNKKALAKQQREEEQRLKQIEQDRAREEQRLKDEQRRLQQLELDRIKQEAHRRKIEERMARMELETKEREAEERQRDVEKLRLEKENAQREERAQRDQLEQVEREKKQRESVVRDMLEREKATKEKAERKRKQKEEKPQRDRERPADKERQPTPRQAPPAVANVDNTPNFAMPQLSSPFGYSLQGLQAGGFRGPHVNNQAGQPTGPGMVNQTAPLNPPVMQPGNVPEPHHISSAAFKPNPPGLPTTSSMHAMQPSSLSPNMPMQALSLQQKHSLLQSSFSPAMPQPSPTLSNLWSTTPSQQASSQQQQQSQPIPHQQQTSQKWNSWSPWSTASEERSTPDMGRTPSPQYQTHSPWGSGGSMWSTSHSNELGDIRRAAQIGYEAIVKDGLGVDGYVPGQVLYHAALDAAGGRFSQNDLYKALAQLPSFECIRDDVGLITHVKIVVE